MTTPYTMACATLLVLVLGCTACGIAPEHDAPVYDDQVEWMEAHAEDFLTQRTFRRTTLEETLWRPDLPYSKKLLDNYALEDEGWDHLPVIDFEVAPVHPDDRAFVGEPLMERRPQTREQWLALGERAFWWMPMRRDPYLSFIAKRPEHWDEVGLERREDGSLQGFVRYIDTRGEEAVGITCGVCHGASGVAGARSSVDLGKARSLYFASRGRDPAQVAAWGPGKLDVTHDGVDDPVVIPNLWGASHYSNFNASGVIRVASPASAAVRFETQYIINHSFEARPDRALPWALAMYVFSLEAPESAHPDDDTSAGREVFAKACAGCHDPQRGYSGGLVQADTIMSDPAIANSPTRGTGFYRTPSLLGISQGGPYFHDASAATLEDVIRAGHPTAPTLGDDDRLTLLDFLKSL